VARRYAQALAQIAQEAGSLQEVRREMEAISSQVRGNADLTRLAFYPLLAPSKKTEAFDAILALDGTSELVRRFYRVVTSAARLDLVHDLSEAFGECVDARMGIVKAQVASVHPLTETQTRTLTDSLARRTGKTIRLQWRQDAALLGGLKVQVGSTIYDATLRGRLDRLKTRLLA
jgi:F-type H+-transporting ATPase subunit delta